MSHVATANAEAQRIKAGGKLETEKGRALRSNATEVERLIADWPKAPQTAARQMLEQYAAPNEVTPTKLLWYGNGPWKRTLPTSDEVAHNFPMPHTDFLTQYIDYETPIERVEQITRFDGSCLVDRTTGEAAARCDSEAANVLTLNLMNDIVVGKATVDEARSIYAENMASYTAGRPTPYCEALQFELPQGETGDPDEAIMTPGTMARQAAGKLKDGSPAPTSSRPVAADKDWALYAANSSLLNGLHVGDPSWAGRRPSVDGSRRPRRRETAPPANARTASFACPHPSRDTASGELRSALTSCSLTATARLRSWAG